MSQSHQGSGVARGAPGGPGGTFKGEALVA